MIVKLPKRMYSIPRTWPGVRLMRLTTTPAQAAAMANLRNIMSVTSQWSACVANRLQTNNTPKTAERKSAAEPSRRRLSEWISRERLRETSLHQTDARSRSARGGTGHFELDRRLQIDELASSSKPLVRDEASGVVDMVRSRDWLRETASRVGTPSDPNG